MHTITIKSIQSVKDLGVTVMSNLKFSQQCKDSIKKASRIMGLIKRNFSLRNKDALSLYNSFADLIWSMPCSLGLPTMQLTNY